MFYFRGKRNRKTYFFVLVIVNFICLYLFEFLNAIDRFFMMGNIPFITNKSTLNLLSDIFTIICLIGFGVVIWLLFCNKAKRVQDIGFSVKWVIILEVIRYFLIFQSFLVVPVVIGDIKDSPILTNNYKFWVYYMPIILGFIPGDLKLKFLKIMDFLKVKKKDDKKNEEIIEDDGIIETE